MSEAVDSRLRAALEAEFESSELSVTSPMVAERIDRRQPVLMRVALIIGTALIAVVVVIAIIGLSDVLRSSFPTGEVESETTIAPEQLVVRSDSELAQDICIVAERRGDDRLTVWWYNPGFEGGCSSSNSSLVLALSGLEPVGDGYTYQIEFEVALLPYGSRPVKAVLELPPGSEAQLVSGARAIGVTGLESVRIQSPGGMETPGAGG